VGGVTSPLGRGTHSQVKTEHYRRVRHSRKQANESTETLTMTERSQKCSSEVKRGFSITKEREGENRGKYKSQRTNNNYTINANE